MRSILPVLAAALVLFLACDDVTGPTVYVAEETFAISLSSSSASQLRLTGYNGNTTIAGVTTADSVRITGVRRVESRESQEDADLRLDGLQVQFGLQENAIVVGTVQPSDQEGRNYTVHYEVTVPKSFSLSLATANGDVRVASMENTVNLAVANGSATLESVFGSVHADVANGQILCSATLPLDGVFDLGVGNGAIDLTIPTSTSAQFLATLANGEIRIFHLDLQDLNRTSVRVSGRLGAGRGTITLAVGNGTITASGVAP